MTALPGGCSMEGRSAVGDRTDPVARLLGALPTVVTLAVTAGSAGAIILGPGAALAPAPTDLVAPAEFFVSEPGDRLALMVWWLIPVVILMLGFAWIRRARARAGAGDVPAARRMVGPLLAGALEVLALGTLVLSITWTVDLSEQWQGISVRALIVGVLLAVAVVVILVGPRRPARVLAAVIGIVVVVVVASNMWQTPSLLADPIHFAYTGDELSAVAAGRFPLSDYIPQYTSLLAYPIAPVLALLGPHASSGVIGWVLLLQVTCLVLAVFSAYRVGGRRTVIPAVLMVCAPVVAVSAQGTSPASYFAVLPLRLVLPTVLIAVTAAVLSARPAGAAGLRWAATLCLGLLAGVVAFNNPDYGIPGVLAVMGVVGLTADGWKDAVRRMGGMLAGIVAVPIGYALFAAATGHTVNWSDWLFFQRIFGQRGFMSVSMLPFGLYVAVVALFITTALTGIFLLTRPSRVVGTSHRAGVLLALVGLWSLLCLPYFAGRSLAPTLVGGYAFLVGFNAAALLPLVPASLRLRTSRVRGARPSGTARFSARPFLLLTFAAVASCLVMASSPWTRFESAVEAESSAPLIDVELSIGAAIGGLPPTSPVRMALEDGSLRQALTNGSLVDLGTGIPVVGPATHPAYYELVPALAARLCTSPDLGDSGMLLVEPTTAASLERVAECVEALDFGGAVPVATQYGDIIAVPVNHGTGDS